MQKSHPFRKDATVTQKNANTFDADTQARFACLLSALGSPEEAALRLGFPPETALYTGWQLSEKKKVRKQVARRGDVDSCRAEVLAGLRRLAFGRINDALTLLGDDFDSLNTSRLDLFNVSEIKRAKGGGVEIRFFDRLEALKRLMELGDSSRDNDAADSFFTALKSTAIGDDV